MAKVINLGRARKRRQREDESRRADANAVKHGRTKADKAAARASADRLAATVDGARRDPIEAESEVPTPPPSIPEREGETT